MAAAIPTLSGVPFNVAVHTHVVLRTPEAESLFEEYTTQIAQAAKDLSQAHLVVSDDKTRGHRSSYCM